MMYLLDLFLKEQVILMPQRKLTLVVGIPSAGRAEILAESLLHISRQSRLPDEVVVCLSAPKDLNMEQLGGLGFNLRILVSTAGSCRQRNHILENVPEADVVVFLDDDFLMSSNYLAEAEKLFVKHPDVAVCTGTVIADGILGPGIQFREGVAILESDNGHDAETSLSPIYNAYGCNMAVRMADVRAGELRFDENLPLYGWLEDVDFSRAAAAYGRIVVSSSLRGVHLGIKIARSPGVRLGYSQIANPIYLMRKHTMSFRHAGLQMGRNILANVLHLWRPEPWVDRKGRLSGNLKAVIDLLTGRLTPRKAEKL
jgi:succinoglycan biosynthesis transport protein ExoP